MMVDNLKVKIIFDEYSNANLCIRGRPQYLLDHYKVSSDKRHGMAKTSEEDYL